tara:strand:+ start:10985 stop:11815 length:831 start_codon:yes stop_codon:yes gene_type:complete
MPSCFPAAVALLGCRSRFTFDLMTATKPFSLELTIQESSGWLGRVGHQTMVGRFCMLHAPGSTLDDAVVAFVAKDAQTSHWSSHERSLTSEQALEVASLVDAIGMPARTPDVSGVFDTSDGWVNLLFRVKKDQLTNSFEIGMQSSGFEGADADALRNLLRTLCSLSGYQGMHRFVVGSEIATDVAVEVAAVPPPPLPLPPRPEAATDASAPKFCSHCGHGVGDRSYPEDGGVPCWNPDCQQPLLPQHVTCQQKRCGHSAPLAATFCWHCGADLRQR